MPVKCCIGSLNEALECLATAECTFDVGCFLSSLDPEAGIGGAHVDSVPLLARGIAL